MELTQETWLALMNRPIPFLEDRVAAAWLLKVATNKSLNEIRRQSYRRHPILEDLPAAGALDPFPEIEGAVVFRRLLEELPPRKASIVISYFLEGMTLDEAAKENRVSVPTVRRTIHAFLNKGASQDEASGGTP